MSDDARKYRLSNKDIDIEVFSGIRARIKPPTTGQAKPSIKKLLLDRLSMLPGMSPQPTETPTFKFRKLDQNTTAETDDVVFLDDAVNEKSDASIQAPQTTTESEKTVAPLLPKWRSALAKLSEFPAAAMKALSTHPAEKLDSEIIVWPDDEGTQSIPAEDGANTGKFAAVSAADPNAGADLQERPTLLPRIQAAATRLSTVPAAMARAARQSIIPALEMLKIYRETPEQLPLQRTSDFNIETTRKQMIELKAEAPLPGQENYWWHWLLYKWHALELRIAAHLGFHPDTLRVGLASFVLAFAIMYMVMRLTTSVDLETINPKFLTQVSPYLSAGNISEKQPRVFFGEVSDDWNQLSYDDQVAEISRVRDWVIVNEIKIAFLTLRGATIAQVTPGKVLMLSEETPVDIAQATAEANEGKEEKEVEVSAAQAEADAQARHIAEQLENHEWKTERAPSIDNTASH